MSDISRGFFIAAALLLANPSSAAEAQIVSRYTDLSGGRCKLLKVDKETGSSVHKCPGVGGFQLLVLDDDSRVSVSVVDPNKKEYPLEYWNVITRSFSSLGRKAEWRAAQQKGEIRPVALIVRVYTSEHANLGSSGKKSYLAVAKISPREICVTDKVAPGGNANESARQAADVAAHKDCLKP